MLNMLDHKTFQSLFLTVIPALDDAARKGTAGRIGIIGGSKNYTGAPFYSSKASLRVGDDDSFKNEFITILPKLHSVVIGPGLGRKKEQFNVAAEVIKMAKQYEIPITIDADAVLLVADSPELIKGYVKAILTPNAREFDYLCEKIGIGSCNTKVVDQDEIRAKVIKLSIVLEGVTICRKGRTDLISNGIMQAECNMEGSGRRCGGQGDILAGAIGTFSYWCNANEPISFKGNASVLAAYAGCCLVRRTNFLTFKKYGRSMLTSDMIKHIGEAFNSLGFK